MKLKNNSSENLKLKRKLKKAKSKASKRKKELNKLEKKIKKRGKAAISDHYPFTEAGVPCFYIYTMGGIQAYHDVYDVPETLPLTEFEDLFKLLTDFVARM